LENSAAAISDALTGASAKCSVTHQRRNLFTQEIKRNTVS